VKVAVVGHVEWVEFVRVERVPRAGDIVHAAERWEEAAGGGAVAAVQLANLGAATTFFTSLGDDELGRRSQEQLASQGVTLSVQVVPERTRRAFTFVDDAGERTITVLGDKLLPRRPLELARFDAVYFVSGDVAALRSARSAPLLVATARELPTLRAGGVYLDALVGSGYDASERYETGVLDPAPGLVVTTEGNRGGSFEPGGRYAAAEPPGPVADTYGCGDCFAAGLTFGLAQGLAVGAAVELGARCGAAVLCGRGAYAGQLTV
jgi:ribokinase